MQPLNWKKCYANSLRKTVGGQRRHLGRVRQHRVRGQLLVGAGPAGRGRGGQQPAQLAQLGRARKVIVTKDETTIIEGAGDPAQIEGRVTQIKREIENTDSDYDREKLQERLAKLAGGVAVLRVGGSTEVEVKEKKDRVDDALNATRAAADEGIVPGGGVALLQASKKLIDLKGVNADQNAGIAIVRRALQAPIRQISENAGVEGSIVVGKILDNGGEITEWFGSASDITARREAESRLRFINALIEEVGKSSEADAALALTGRAEDLAAELAELGGLARAVEVVEARLPA